MVCQQIVVVTKIKTTYQDLCDSFLIDWTKCVTYSSDKTNSAVGIQESQGKQKVFDVGYSCRFAHAYAGKAAKELSVNAEDFVIGISCLLRKPRHKGQ